jgi:SNF2-related domain/Helicase conserved C-terminal domain/Restriction endonuclease
MPIFSPAPTFIWSANSTGLAIRFSNPKHYASAQQGRADEASQLGLIRMQMLAECGQAEVREVDAGIFIAAADAVRLDMETREGFQLPPPWPGGMRLQTESVPQSSSFVARLGLVDPGAGVRWEWKLRGPIFEMGKESYLPTSAQYAALLAFQNWREVGERDELANLSLLATLREARQSGCHMDLEAYDETLIAIAQELSIDARLEGGSGDLILRPIVSGEFPALSSDSIEKRLGQMAGDSPRAVVRVGQTIVLLDPTQTRQARALVERGRVPKAAVKAFKKDPASWMAEHVFPDIETEFSPRVTGIGVWKAAYAGSMWEEGEDWFGKKPQSEKKPRGEDEGKGDPERSEGQKTDDKDEDEAGPLVTIIHTNDTELIFGQRFAEIDQEGGEPDFSRYARDPMKHQQEAVLWLLRHARRAMRRLECRDEMAGLGAGALLADDMGLGKTFSALIFLREWFDLWRGTVGGEPPAVLIVAPLSLLENWKAEIEKSYGEGNSVFSRVLIAQSDGELNLVRRRPGSRDRAVPGEVLEYGLGFGDGTERSIDLPGSCVLTTYQTLRDYRFSFAKAEWSAAIFDEAQNIKNPNALQTIAAKSLKALFRLTLTGTPVENHLGDFWSILDTSEPGPFGSFVEFRKKWITPMIRQPENMAEIGSQLSAHVGKLMMRRMKEDELTGLPKKSGHNQSVPVELTAEQVIAYDAIVASAQGEDPTAETSSVRQNRQLAALWQLRQVSLHPDLLAGGTIGTASNQRDSRAMLQRSGKLAWLLQRLDEIKPLGEKVLVFCVQKKLQEALARHLALIHGISVPIINGDTKATSRHDPEKTRLGLIDQFSRRDGFGICILSPIAAGAGLNIVAANHVIHLERHWNPAKEDQATDRAYRIGQTRAVLVYLPAARHPNPERRSFDDVLHGLIEKKRGLQGALGLVPPQSVTDSELIETVLAPHATIVLSAALDLTAALRLSWRLFEALTAVLYERDAERVILTPGGSDHGCDVVVLGWGAHRENVLIQCKATSLDELNSEVAVREVEGARPFYENALGISFRQRCLHTTARRVSKRTLQAAKICGVTVNDRAWLSTELARSSISLAALLAKDSSRERVG